jgi:hypothetical protein
MIAVLVDDYQIDVVSLSNNERTSTMENPAGKPLYGPEFSRDNSLIWAKTEDQTAFVWRTENGELIREFEDVLELSLNPIFPSAALLRLEPNREESRTLSIVSLLDGSTISEIKAPEDSIFIDVKYSPDGSVLMVQRDSGHSELLAYDPRDLTLMRSTIVCLEISDFSYTADGDYIIANVFIGQATTRVQFIRAADLTVAMVRSLGGHTLALPRGNRYGCSYENRNVNKYTVGDIDNNTEISYELPKHFRVTAITDDGLRAIGSHNDQIVEYNFEDGSETVVYGTGTLAQMSYPELTILM